MTDTVNTVLLYMGRGRYVPGALAVATECLCVLGPNLCLCINSWESIRSEACLAFASLSPESAARNAFQLQIQMQFLSKSIYTDISALERRKRNTCRRERMVSVLPVKPLVGRTTFTIFLPR